MSKPVLSCKKETSVKEAAELMAHNNVGCLIVVDKDKPRAYNNIVGLELFGHCAG